MTTKVKWCDSFIEDRNAPLCDMLLQVNNAIHAAVRFD